jgi:hypothetical protein
MRPITVLCDFAAYRSAQSTKCISLTHLSLVIAMVFTPPSIRLLWRALSKEDTRRCTSRLETLPVEILQHLSDYLSLDSAASLLCCSHTILEAVGDHCWYALRQQINEHEKRQFLSLLQRDIDHLLFCHHCGKLHPNVGLHPPWLYRDEHSCTRADGTANLQTGPKLRFQHAQMIMKVPRSRRVRGDNQ